MVNTNKLTANYIVSRLYKEDLLYFTTKMFGSLFSIDSLKTRQVVFSLKKGGLIKEIEKGKYLVLGFEPQRVLVNPFFIASKIVYPSYISFRSALNHYGYTEQVPFTIYVAATKRKRGVEFETYRYKYITLAPYKFFGYEKQIIGELPVLMAEKEKALIDSFDQLDYAGGFLEAAKALFRAKDEIDKKRLVSYALKMKNKSLLSRLGYLLKRYNARLKGLENYLSQTFIPLDPDRPKGRIWDKKWRVNVNVSDKDLFAWRQS